MNSIRPTVELTFVIGGSEEFDVSRISAIIGFPATEIWRPPRKWPTNTVLENLQWHYSATYDHVLGLTDVMMVFLKKFETVDRDNLKCFVRSNNLTVSLDCRIRGDFTRMIFTVSDEVCKLVASFGATIAFYLFDYEDHD